MRAAQVHADARTIGACAVTGNLMGTQRRRLHFGRHMHVVPFCGRHRCRRQVLVMARAQHMRRREVPVPPPVPVHVALAVRMCL